MGARRELAEAEASIVRENAAGMCERQRRLYLGSVSHAHGPGWDVAVADAAHSSRKTVARGRREWEAGERWGDGDRCRAPGAGRPSCAELFAARECDDPDAPRDLVAVVAAVLDSRGYGDPCGDGPVHSSATARSVADSIRADHGFAISARTALRLCRQAGYSRQRNAKQDQVGERHPLRDAQFHVRDEVVGACSLAGLPVVSVDTKAKVMLGNFAARGSEWRPKGVPRRTSDHDFAVTYAELYSEAYPGGHPDLDPALAGRLAVASPYGVYDVGLNLAHVTVGVGADTSEFACASIAAWWRSVGRDLYPGADELLVLADGGGSNRAVGWLFKYELALALLRCGLRAATVVHLAPGTSKYNPIEHRLWPHVESARRGRPVRTVEALRDLVGQATTEAGLRVTCGIDWADHPTEKRRRQALRDAGVSPSSLPSYRERLEAVATVERPFSNPTLSQWCYRIEVLAD